MTDHVGRLYAAACAVAALFVAWAGIAARPWADAPRDPRLVALDRREQRLNRDAALVQQVLDGRWAAYRAALGRAAAQSAPQARIVRVPPVATTRSS